METTHTKFWPDVKVPDGAVYIGSDPVAKDNDPTDFYIVDGTLYWADKTGPGCDGLQIDEVLSSKEGHSANWRLMAAALLRAHFAKQPAPAPHADLIEAIAAELAKFASDKPWDEWLPFDQKYIREQATAVVGVMRSESVAVTPGVPATRMEFIERVRKLLTQPKAQGWAVWATEIVDEIHPELRPQPAPVEPVKTEGQEIAERMLRIEDLSGRQDDSRLVFMLNCGMVSHGLYEVRKGDDKNALLQQDRLREARGYLAASIDNALAARDAAHQRAMGDLRVQLRRAAMAWYSGSTHGRERLEQALDEVPAPKAEAKP